MAEKSSFFDSVNADRVYYAADWALHLSKYFTNGIFNNGLKVVSNDNMSVSVESGDANINGYRYNNDPEKVLSVANADGVLNRIDNIVIRLDIPNRQITAEIVQGTFAEKAVAPALTRGTSIYEIRIAKINIPAGTTAITTDLIEDTRFNSSDCGNVICAVQTPDFTNILDQYKALWDSMIKAETQDFEKWFKEQTENFDVWFERIKGQLSEDAAAKLQLLIDDLTLEIAKEKENHNNDIEKIAETMLDCISTENGEYIVSEDKEYIMVESENTNQNDEIRKILLDNDTIIVELIIKEKLCTIIAYTKDEACLDTYESSCSFDFEVPKEYLPNINMTSYSPNLYISSSGEDAIISGFSELTILGKNSSDYGINMGIIQLQIVKERLQSFYTTISYYIDN